MKRNSILIILSTAFIGFFLMAAAPIESAPAQGEEVKEIQIPNQLMGFQGWKQKRVFKARATLDAFKMPMEKEDVPEATEALPPVEGVEKSKENEQTLAAGDVPTEQKALVVDELSEKLRQLEFNLEIALGLTIHDYFALYLKNKSQQEMANAIQKLSPSELSELLMAYRKSLYGAPQVKEGLEKQNNQSL